MTNYFMLCLDKVSQGIAAGVKEFQPEVIQFANWKEFVEWKYDSRKGHRKIAAVYLKDLAKWAEEKVSVFSYERGEYLVYSFSVDGEKIKVKDVFREEFYTEVGIPRSNRIKIED